MTNKLAILLSLSLLACGSTGSDSESISGLISSSEGGSLKVGDSETGVTFPVGAVDSDVEVTLSVAQVSEFAENAAAIDQVLVFAPSMTLVKPASVTFQLAADFDFTQTVHMEQFVDGEWIRPELSGVEIGSGGIAYGLVDTLVPTALVVDATDAQ